MIEVRPFATLGKADHGWLQANFHFSFADYFDQRRMHWGKLRVWNDDVIAPHSGFPPHPHADMEIITYVREGAITGSRPSKPIRRPNRHGWNTCTMWRR